MCKYVIMIYSVNNIYEAYDLLVQFRAEKRYHWFRGQSRNWAILPSLLRLNEIQRKKSIEKLGRFYSWLSSASECQHLGNKVDTYIAIAQHYGLPTPFLDFTTDPKVACFFASQKKWARSNWESTIICLNRYVFNRLLKIFPSAPLPELLDLDIKDLWRLKAQKSKFMYLPYINIETFYQFDRIIFPFNNEFNIVKKEEVIPYRKSPLEVVIDSYFCNEKTQDYYNYLDSNKIPVYNIPYNDETSKVLFEKPLIHISWRQKNINLWQVRTNKRFQTNPKALKITIEIDQTKNLPLLFENIADKIFSCISIVHNLQHKIIEWELKHKNRIIMKSDYLNIYWDGVKYLPYKIEDLVIGFSNCIILQLIDKITSTMESEKYEKYLFHLWGKILLIEFSTDIIISRAFLGVNDLQRAIRSDIGKYLKNKDLIDNNLVDFLMCFNKAKHIFDYNKLAQLFIRQIIPSQISYYGRSRPIIYSPINLEILGIA